MYKSSGLQFFRITTGIKSGPNTFNKARLVVTFWTNLRVREILCRFRLVLEKKTGKEMPESSRLEILGKFSANIIALSDTSWLLNREGIADLTLLRTLLVSSFLNNYQKSQEPSFWGAIDYFLLLVQ